MKFSNHLSFSLLAALCLASSGFALDEGKKDVRLGAVSVPQAIKQLEQIYAVDLNASGTVKDDVIFLSASGVTFAEIREKIAQVLNAEWRSEGETWTLIRLGATERAEWDKYYSDSAKLVKAALAKSLKKAEGQEPFSEATASAMFGQMREGRMNGGSGFDPQKLIESLPGGKSTVQVLNMIPASEIAKIPVGARAVFSTRPSRVQGAIPGNVMPIATKLVAESQIVQQTAMRTFAPPGTGDAVVGGFGGPAQGQPGPATQVMVVISRSASGETFTCSMTVADAQGSSLASGSHSIELADEVDPGQKLEFPKGQPLDFSPFEALISLMKTATGSSDSPVTEIVMNINGGMLGSLTRPALDPKAITPTLRDLLRQPDKFDPLNLFIGPLLEQVAQSHKMNMVGWLPDNLVTARTHALGTTIKDSEQFINHVMKEGELTGNINDQWLTFVPKFGVASRNQRIDRFALGTLLRTLTSKGTVTLVEQGNYAVTAPAASPRAFDSVFGQLLAPEVIVQVLSGDDRSRDVLRVFGALAPNQRFALLNNQRILVGTLAQPARNALNHLVFWSPDGPRSANGGRGRRGGGMMFMMGGGFQDVATERTSVLSNGIPNEATIGIEQLTEPTALVQMTDGSTQQMGARQVALSRMMSSPDSQFRMMGGPVESIRMPEMKGFKMLDQAVFTFDFLLAQEYGMRRTVTVPVSTSSTGFVGLDQLPSTFLALVKQYEEEMSSRMGRGPGGGGPPGGRGRANP